jgi:hypothetical protein
MFRHRIGIDRYHFTLQLEDFQEVRHHVWNNVTARLLFKQAAVSALEKWVYSGIAYTDTALLGWLRRRKISLGTRDSKPSDVIIRPVHFLGCSRCQTSFH